MQDTPAATRAMPTQMDQPMPLAHSLESPQSSPSWGFREMTTKLSARFSTVSKKWAQLSDPLQSSESGEGEETISESELPTIIENLNEIKKLILFTACRECGNSLELIVDKSKSAGLALCLKLQCHTCETHTRILHQC